MNKNLCRAGSLKLSLYLRGRILPELFERFSAFLSVDVTREETDRIENLLESETAAEKIILEATKDNPIARTCVELALFEYSCPFAEELFGYVIPDCGWVSLKLSALISGADIFTDAEAMIDAYFIVSSLLSRKAICSDISMTRFCADFTLISLMCGSYAPSSELMNYLYVSSDGGKEEMILWKKESEQLAKQISSVKSAVCVIFGDELSGRRFFCEYTARLCGLRLFAVDYDYLGSSPDDSTLSIRLSGVIRDCFLLQSALCIALTSEGAADKINRIIKRTVEEFSFCSLPIFITAKPDAQIAPHIGEVRFSVVIPTLNASQSRTVWKYFADRPDIALNVNYEKTAERILLPVGKIKRAVSEASAMETDNERGLAEICYGLIEDTGYKGIKRVYPKYQWKDIKLPESTENMLKRICSHAEYCNSAISEQWNTQRLYPYGKCISALFTGPPGTGKTMAAHVIADALNLAIYKVDLSQVVDKYIGETEKHLEKIFETAEKGNMILFIDEADALLGKRSEVTSSHDKYANNEAAFLLQRMEEFNGIIIMATNLINNIDSAFMRRIRYTVHFSMPDKSIRARIWRSLFTDSLSHDEIDFELLSDKLELSGAEIKNIMLGAMIKAASEKIPLNMKHILSCASEEYDKLENHIFAQKILGYTRSMLCSLP